MVQPSQAYGHIERATARMSDEHAMVPRIDEIDQRLSDHRKHERTLPSQS